MSETQLTKQPDPAREHAVNTGVWAVFLMNGFWDVVGYTESARSKNQQQVYHRHTDDIGLGMDGMVQEMATIAEHLASRFMQHWMPRVADAEWPGVFDYEVIEPFGSWLANRPHAFSTVTLDEIITHLDEQVAAWFVTDTLLRN